MSNLCFVDDLIIFTRGRRHFLRRLFEFLKLYELALGQRINMQKNNFFTSRSCSLAQERAIFQLMGIASGHFPMRYLGYNLFYWEENPFALCSLSGFY